MRSTAFLSSSICVNAACKSSSFDMLPLVGMMSEVEMPVSARAAETLFARPDLTGARRPDRSCEGGAFEAFGAIPVGIGCRSMQSTASAKRDEARTGQGQSRASTIPRQIADRRRRTFGSRDPALATFSSPAFRQRVDAGDHLPARTLLALLGVLRALTDPLGSATDSELDSRPGNADTLPAAEQMQELGPLRGDLVVVLLDPARLDVEEIFLCDLSRRPREKRSQVVLALRFAVCARQNEGSARRKAPDTVRHKNALMSKLNEATVSCRALSAFSFSAGSATSGAGRFAARARHTA